MKEKKFDSKFYYLLLPFIGGALFAMGFPMGEFRGLIVTPIIGMVLFLLPVQLPYLKNKNPCSLKVELLALLFFSMGYCIVGYYWIPQTLKAFGNISFPFNHVLGILFSLIIAPQLLLFILLKNLVNKFKQKSFIFLKSRTSRNLFFALCLSLLEHYTPQQFPAHLGQTWLGLSPFVGLAPFVGVPLFSFFNFWLVFAIVDVIKNQEWDRFAFISFSIFTLINISFPLKYHDEREQKVNNIRLVQANVGNFMKIQSESGSDNFLQEVYGRYESLSTRSSSVPLDLIIWPETAYPKLLTSKIMKNYPGSIPNLLTRVINKTKSELFIGGYDRKATSKKSHFETEYNATFHFTKDAKLKGTYHKMKLIPFGEGLPFGPFNEALSQFITNVSYFAEGEQFTLFKTMNQTPFITHICYEILFSSFTRNYLNSVPEQPQFIINLTNDSWYGDTSEPYQHLYLAHWRALEFNIPIVRMTNTGITSILYPDGSESRRTKIGTQEILDIKLVTYSREVTLYQRFGILMTILTWLILSLITFSFTRKS